LIFGYAPNRSGREALEISRADFGFVLFGAELSQTELVLFGAELSQTELKRYKHAFKANRPSHADAFLR
jgi:hypothetical protein